MSTKTSFKRIALAAALSLGLGVLTSVPANATTTDVTTVLGTVTPADGSAAVGSVVTIPLKLTTAVIDTVTSFTATATFAQKPVNTALVNTSIVANTANLSTKFGATAATNVIAAVPSANAIAYTSAAASTTNTAQDAGAFVFTPDVPGIYNVTIAIPAGTNTGTVTTTATTNITIIVGGAQLTQATSGKGTATGTATTAGSAVVFYQLPGATAAAARYNVTSTGVGSINNPVACATDDATMVAAATVVRCVNGAGASVGSGTINGTNYNDGLYFTNTTLNAGNVLIGPAQTAALTFDAASATAGTQTITITSINLATGAPTTAATVTITWGATPGISTTTSTSFIQAGIGANSATSDATVLASKTAANVANIAVTLKDGNGNALNGQKLTVTIDGPGLIGVDVNSVDGVAAGLSNRIYADSSANAGNVWQIGITSDGTAGKSTITISVGTTVVATESLTFYGSIAKLVATNNLIAVANGSTTTDVVNVCALDSNGNPVPGAVLYGVTGDSTIASVAATATAHNSSTAVVEDYDTGTADPATGFNDLVNTAYRSAKNNGCAGFSVTAASQTTKDSVVLTFRDAALAADATVSTTSTVKVGGKSAAAVTLSSDKSSYAAGAKGTITLTFKDATGRLVGAGAGTGTLTGALTSSASLQGATLFAANNSSKLGEVTADVYFPWNAGTVTITGTTGTNSTFLDSAARSVGLTKSITVTAAADSTSAQIASLISKINALSKLIAKIQKKLGIK